MSGSSGKMSLLEEAKARSAASQAAKGAGSSGGQNPFNASVATKPSHDAFGSAPVPAPASAPPPPPVQQYQQQQQQQQYQPQPQYNNSLMQSTTLGQSTSALPPQPPTPARSVPASAPPVDYSALSPKDAAKAAKADWKHNAEKMNAQSVNSTVASGGEVAPRWVPNSERPNCCRCNVAFDWVVRRHHCRRCGNVFCGNCTNKKALLPTGTAAKTSDTKNPRRVCLDCFEASQPEQDVLALSQSNAVRTNDIDLSANRYLNSPVRFTMGAEIRKAAYIIHNFGSGLETAVNDVSVPLKLIRDACGLAILTVMKVGFIWTGRIGTGLVISRRGDGTWSPPSAIMMAGCGFGAQIGGEVADVVIVLTSASAVSAFAGKGQLSLGGELSVAVGPLGRSAEGALKVGDKGLSSCISYSHSKGLFAGISIEGAVVSQRPDINSKFYGTDKYTPADLLKGNVPPAPAAKPLYDALKQLLDSDPTAKQRAGYLGDAQNAASAAANQAAGGGVAGAVAGHVASQQVGAAAANPQAYAQGAQQGYQQYQQANGGKNLTAI